MKSRRPETLLAISVASLMFVGALAPSAQASPVTNVSVTNTSPSNAAGARTVYAITFTTSSTGGLSAGAGNKITINFPSGTDLSTVDNSSVLNSSGTDVGSCSEAKLTATCGLFGGTTIAASSSVTVNLDGVTNKSATAPGTRDALQVATSADTSTANGFFLVVAGNPITKLSAVNSTPSNAGGARTVYTMEFDTSGTGGLSATANSQITITFPSGTNLSTVDSSSVLNSSGTDLGSCSQTGLVATCGFFGGNGIGAGSEVIVQLDGVTNAPANPTGGQLSLSAQTSSDTAPQTANFSVVQGNAITQPSVTMNSPSNAAGARTVYSIQFDTSSTGGLSSAANSQITITFPSGTNLSTVDSSSVLNSSGTDLGSCSETGLVATCGFFGGNSVAAGAPVTVVLDAVTNPASGAPTLTAQTTSDTTAVTSSPYSIVANNPLTQLSATINSPSNAAGARTVYSIAFDTSSTGGLSAAADSQITITFPSGTDLSKVDNSSILNSANTDLGSCSETGLVATCGFFGGNSVAAGAPVTVVLDAVTNPASGSPALTAQTTSDTTAVRSSSYSVVAAHQVSQPSVSLSNSSPTATGVTYAITFNTSSTGGLSSAADSQVAITFPTGTDLSKVNSSSVLNTANTDIGSCSESGLVATCGFFGGNSVAAGAPLTVKLQNVTNPTTTETTTLSAATTSDPASQTSSPYGVGNTPSVSGVSPASGPTSGGTSVTITGTNFTAGASVSFGSSPATSVAVSSTTQITATSPPGSGSVDVRVTTASGPSPTGTADVFTYNAPSTTTPPTTTPPAVTGGAPTSQTGGGAPTASGTVNPENLTTTAFFEYGLDPAKRGPGASSVLYDQSTPVQQVGSDGITHTITASLTGLVPGALYHVRLVATNTAGTTFGQDQTFTTAAAPAPPPPVLGKSEDIKPVSGTVFIRTASGQFIPLTGAVQVTSGTVIDALHGSLQLLAALGKGKTDQGIFGGAVFRLTQAASGINRGLTTLQLLEGVFSGAPSYATCKAHKAADATIASTNTLQLLHASAHGKFSTRGRYSAATVRGTIWTIADRCDGTITHDITDSVAVTDFVHHKTIILHAGQSYLARKP